MRRAGFTLIELLTIIAIMGTMVAVGVVSWQRGKSRAQLVGAARDIMAIIRQARSTALITQKPAIIRYETESDEEGEPCAKITVEAAKLFEDTEDNAAVYTLSGDLVRGEEAAVKPATDKAATTADGESAAQSSNEEGESISDVLTPTISREIARGLRLKVLKEDEQLTLSSSVKETQKSAISVFSTVSGVMQALGKTAKTTETESTEETAATENEAPVEIVWSTNGRADGHTVWVYPDGSTPEKGLSVVVDKFGGCKVSQWEEDER